MKRYEQIPHTADLAAKIYGSSLQELFENAAFAMFDMMGDLEGLGPEETVDIQVEAPDTEDLLISWLNEVLYASYIKKMLFTEFKVGSIENNKLTAVVKGQEIGETPDRIRSEIKAATYHDLKIEKTSSGFQVTIVFDV